MQKNNRWYFSLLLTTLFIPVISRAADELAIEDSNTLKSPPQALPIGDVVEKHSGDLTVLHNDLTWSGNGGMDIVINRFYTMRGANHGGQRALSKSFRWRAMGGGWSMVVAPRWIDTKSIPPRVNKRKTSDVVNLCSNLPFASVDASERAYIELMNGSRETMFFVGNYTARSKNNWRAVCASGNVTLTSPDGINYDLGNIEPQRLVWDTLNGPSGNSQLLVANKATDSYGNWIAYTYNHKYFSQPSEDSDGWASLPTSITSSDGRILNLTYDDTSGRLLSMYDNNGRAWTYDYAPAPVDSTSRQLASVTLPEGRKWQFTYSSGAVVSQDYKASALARKLATITYPEGGIVTYAIEAEVTNPGTPALKYSPRVITRTLSTGGTWQYSYVRGGVGQYDLTSEIRPDGVKITYQHMGLFYASSQDINNPTNTGWLFGMLMEKNDSLGGREVNTWRQRELIASPWRTSNTWDAKVWAPDLASQVIYRDGATYSTTYSNFDIYGNPGSIAESGPNGGVRTTARTYYIDTAKWLVKQVKDETSPGSSRSQLFNANGKVSSITKDGVTTSFTYDVAGNVESVTNPRGLVYSYSNYMRGIAQYESQPEGITISRVVDGAGNVTSETNGEGFTTTTTYDKLNRPTMVKYPIGSTRAFSYSATTKAVTRGNLVETTEYDPFGLPSRITLGGIATTYIYDALGRKTFQSNPGSTSGTTYRYDQFGRIKSVSNADGTSSSTSYGAGTVTQTNERNQSTVHTYRAYGNPDQNHLIAITAADASANISMVRNSADLITSAVQGGVTRTYAYNANNYLIEIVNPETGKTVLGRDIAGNMTSRSVGNTGTTTMGYDGQNRLISVRYPDTTPAVTKTYTKTSKLKTVVTSAVTRTYDYDANDNLSKETQTSDGISLSVMYGYNSVDQLATITYPYANHIIDYAPDVLGRPTKVSNYISNISYWPSGQINQLVYGNGMVTSYNQNSRLWPQSFSTQKNGTYFINSSYSYDGVGNLVGISDAVDSAFNRILGYDGIDRLTSAAGSWGTGTIAYDGVGNISSQVLGSASQYYNYDGSNRLANVSGARTGSYGYDAQGNVISALGNFYYYDMAFNLVCVNCDNSSNKVEYVYDGLNQRVSVRKAGIKTYEMYGSHGNQLIEYTPGKSNKLTEYIYLGGKRIAQRVSTQ